MAVLVKQVLIIASWNGKVRGGCKVNAQRVRDTPIHLDFPHISEYLHQG